MKISSNLVLIICLIGAIVTSVYLGMNLDHLERLAWGIFGLCIFVGTIVSEGKDKRKYNQGVKN
jgi:hypothetical protein